MALRDMVSGCSGDGLGLVISEVSSNLGDSEILSLCANEPGVWTAHLGQSTAVVCPGLWTAPGQM